MSSSRSAGAPLRHVGAAILAGFNQVMYVGTAVEQQWMQLPSEAEESMHKIDYSAFASPNIDMPGEGILAAEAVRMLPPMSAIMSSTRQTP